MTAAAYTEAESVLVMRIERFTLLGVPYPQALELAMSAADIHQAEEMAEQGCSPELLYAILT